MNEPKRGITRPSNRAIDLFSNNPRGFLKLSEAIQHKTKLWAICNGHAKPGGLYWEWYCLAKLADEAATCVLKEKPVKRLTPAQRRKRKHAALMAAKTRLKNLPKGERRRIANNKKARSIHIVSGGKFS